VDLQDALKFVELVGTTVANVCDLRRLQARSVALSQFFSPPVRQVVAAADPDRVLAPRKTELSVLFCDLRGFSRQSEEWAEDLFGLLQRVSEALGIMTRQILDFGGVIGDFHGDAAMGFWGWPLVNDERALHACSAALAIRAEFYDAARYDHHALAGFRVGMGLATGEAVAGKLGTVDQVKVTAFGPVVNRASRLEGLTRPFGVAILIDIATAQAIAQSLPVSQGRIRPVARLQPYGMESVEDVFELLPPAAGAAEAAADERLAEALELFRQGDWDAARGHFDRMADNDPIGRFYRQFLATHGNASPNDWDGVLRFHDKT
jgi:adenylate cyclase